MTGVFFGAIAALLAASAVITAASTAAFLISGSRLRTLEEEGFRGADALARLRADGPRTRAGVRVLTGAFNLAAVGLATWGLAGQWGTLAAIGVLLGGIVAVLLVTDLLPRALVATHPVRAALLAAPFLLAFGRALRVLSGPFARLEEAVAGGTDGDESHEARELREIQELGREEGVLEAHENLLVERAFRLDELTAWDVMTPRVDVFAWKEDQVIEEIVPEFADVPYSRVPVYGESVDDITGILYVREAYEAYVAGKRGVALAELAREAFFVPGSLSLSKLMRHFQGRRIHMGVVADEFGGIDGIVTLEDVLEELVGEIVDETDVDEEEFVRVSENEALADAGVDVRDINRHFGVSLPLLEHRSLNGLILEELGYVPSVGESLECARVRIEVVEATETQVARARLVRLQGHGGAADQGETSD